MYEYNAKIVNVVDGDTFDVDIDLGFHIHIHERIRVLDLDTPEKRGNKEKEAGLAVTEYATKNFLNREIVLRSREEIEKDTDSFGRWLCEVLINGKSMADIYTKLGANKLENNYSEQNALKLKDL